MSKRMSRPGRAAHRHTTKPVTTITRNPDDFALDEVTDWDSLEEQIRVDPHLALKLFSVGVARAEKIHKSNDFDAKYRQYLDTGSGCPYMVNRRAVALELARLGRLDEAIEHFREMIDLGPDRLGVRYLYLAVLLAAGRNADADRLLASPVLTNDPAAEAAYARALLAYRMEGPTVAANELLAAAIGANPFVGRLLTNPAGLPEEEPQQTGHDQESQAVIIALDQFLAWNMTRGALDWLRVRAEPDAGVSGMT